MKTLTMLLAAALLAALPAPAIADDGPEVTLKFEDAPVLDVIQMIAGMAKVNVIVSPKVKGSVTVDFRDTPWRTALETVVKSTGNVLIEEDFGIYMVLPEAEARRQLEHRKAAAEKRYAELEAQVAAVKQQLAAAKKQAAQAASGREHVAAAQKSYEEALAQLGRAKKARGTLGSALAGRKAADPNEQVLQVHAIADLEKKGLDIQKISKEVLGKDVTEIGYSNGHLSVRATRAAQKRLATYLGKMRAWKFTSTIGYVEVEGAWPAPRTKTGTKTITVGKKQPMIVVDTKGAPVLKGRVITTFGVTDDKAETDDKARLVVRTKRSAPLKTEVHTTWQKTGKKPPVLTTKKNGEFYISNDDGRSWRKRDQAYKSGDHDFKVAYIWRTADEAALEARAENLRKAAELLASAGDRAGAARVRDQAAAALKQLAEARKQRFDAERGWQYTRAEDGKDAKLMNAVTGLRREVGALRNDVRELTALVRQLVEQRR